MQNLPYRYRRKLEIEANIKRMREDLLHLTVQALELQGKIDNPKLENKLKFVNRLIDSKREHLAKYQSDLANHRY